MAVAEEAYSPAGAHEDAAYLRIAMSLPANDLRAFLDDVERLYRINPLLEISAFEPAGRRAIISSHTTIRTATIPISCLPSRPRKRD
jgi:hypothetical protein